MALTTDDLGALERKYRELVALRRQLGADRAAVVERLRALAQEFPGALRELDALTEEDLERRLAAIERACAGGAGEAWMAWIHRFHVVTRAALAIKRELARGKRGETAAALAERLGPPCDAALVAAVSARRDGRMSQLAASRVEAEFGLDPGGLVPALFGRGGGAPSSEGGLQGGRGR